MALIGLIYDHPRVEEKLIAGELRNRGLNVEMVNVNRIPLPIGGEGRYDVVVVRTMSLYSGVYSAVAFESQGSLSVNSSYTLMVAGDKILTLGLLASSRVPVVDSLVAVGREAVMKAADMLGYPLVDKPPVGSWGRLVSLVAGRRHHEDIVEHRSAIGAQFKVHLVQRYMGPGGRDVRCIVIGGSLLGCIDRIAPEGEWRSNVALGADVRPRRVDSELEDIAVRAARMVKGGFVSVDIFESDDGYRVNEVNGIPEFKGFMKATGVNPAERLAEWLVEAVKS